jgi:histidinol-phosphate aminotransferase
MLSARESLRNLKPYEEDVELVRRTGLRLDLNENTSGCSPRVVEQLRTLTAEDLTRYAERDTAERLVAEFLGLRPEEVLLTNGVDEAIQLICQAYLEREDEVIVVVPAFAMYEQCALATGARVCAVAAEADFRFPTERLLRAIMPRTRLIAVANPNNPTGVVAETAELLRVAQAAPNAAVLVDEAYFEFYGESVLREIRSFPNLFVTRTFSKAYGLAGLRLGLVAASSEQVKNLRRVTLPFNVNAVALACLPAALADQEHMLSYVAQVRAGRERLQDELRRLGIQSWPSHANFVLARLGEAHLEFIEAMRRRGILVRDRNTDAGCTGCVRITLGIEEHNHRLVAALREVIPQVRGVMVREATR